jgi:hypothetical protein
MIFTLTLTPSVQAITRLRNRITFTGLLLCLN